jgi:hypothetical protein
VFSTKRARLFAARPLKRAPVRLTPRLGSGLRLLRAVALRLAEEVIVNTREVLTAFCARYPGATFVMETGTHNYLDTPSHGRRQSQTRPAVHFVDSSRG